MLAFQRLQAEFAAHLRDPEAHPPPAGIEARRMAIYRRLFIGNIRNFLAQAYPILHSLMSDADWLHLTRRFYAEHRCEHPQFTQVAAEFLAYLQHAREAQPDDLPFLLELVHYEWVELELTIDDTPAPASVDAQADLLATPCVVSPWLRLLSYQYPVHRIGPDYRPDTPPETPTFLVAYRPPRSGVHFMQINAMTTRLLAILQAESRTGLEVLDSLAAMSEQPVDTVRDFGAPLLEDFRNRGIILGGLPRA